MCLPAIIAVESLGPLNEIACQFLQDLGRRISAQSCTQVTRERERERERERAFLFQLSFSDSTLSCSITVLRRQLDHLG